LSVSLIYKLMSVDT